MLVNHLEESPKDILGDVFHELELHNDKKGQFFTPYPLCQMMAKMIIGDSAKNIVAEKGFISVSEPACGTGAMVIAAAQELRTQGVNYQQNLHVTAFNLDPACVHAAFVQFRSYISLQQLFMAIPFHWKNIAIGLPLPMF